MAKITDIFGEFESEQHKLDFMSAQMETINNLTKQVEQLKKENKQLFDQSKKLAAPAVTLDKQQDEISFQEQICREQLRLLNSVSLDRELTAEEARKVEIYSKILTASKDPNKKQKSPVDGMSTEQLLKLVKDE